MSGHVLRDLDLPPAGTGSPVPSGRLLGLTRLALVPLDGHGHVLHWTAQAEELFGCTIDETAGRSFGEMFQVPGSPGAALDGTCSPDGQAIAFVAPALRRERLTIKNIAWWVYPMPPPGPVRLLVFAVEAAELREVSLSLSVGDQLIVRPRGAPGPRRGLRVPSLSPCVLPVEAASLARLRHNLAEALRVLPPECRRRASARILALGYPGIGLIVTARLPFDVRNGAVPEETTLPATAAPRQLAFINRATARIASRLDPVHAAAELAGAMVPHFAEFAEVHVVEEVLAGPRTPRSSRVPWRIRRLARTEGPPPRPDPVEVPASSLLAHTLNTGEPVHLPRAPGDPAFGDRLLEAVPHSGPLTILPLVARGAVVGDLLLAHAAHRPAPAGHDLAAAEEIARVAATSIADAGLLQHESRIAEALQSSLLPRAIPELTGVRVAHRYLPGSAGARAGGDWFDAIPLPRDRVALTVGDVMGHDWRSAATMGQLRTAIQAFASLDLDPLEVLRRLDTLAPRLGDGSIATCVYAVYDPVQRHCTIANAGHVPPVLIAPDGSSRLLRLPAGVPIGVGGHPFGTAGLRVENGSRLVLCTDGLVERAGADIEARLGLLCDHLAGAGRALDDLCDDAVSAMLGTDRHDDVALLAAEFRGVDRPRGRPR
ncbi:PP2C family protein-serine/threonine phosphatase [Spirillospora sp. NPDC048911]|uniref:PP2C family protein-serine/threonine phosphatase n=1 Tax=Spirillospora sp. NPDC048911 TaxID=3364527 RepID=UPI0037208DF5